MDLNVEQKLWERVDKYLPILAKVPFLRMVAVCNNLAFGKVDYNSDIDLFIIARRGRLFIVRALVTLILHLRGVRRHGYKIAGRFCLSFFVDDSNLNLFPIAIEKDYYLAIWIKTMIPVIDDGIYGKFIEKNDWINGFFEDNEKYGHPRIVAGHKKSFVNGFSFSRFGNLLEWIMKKWQIYRASRKVKKADDGASLIVNEHMLKFHNVDRRALYRDKWIRKFGVSEKITREKFLSL